MDFVQSGSESSESSESIQIINIHQPFDNLTWIPKFSSQWFPQAHPKAAEDLDIRPVALVWAWVVFAGRQHLRSPFCQKGPMRKANNIRHHIWYVNIHVGLFLSQDIYKSFGLSPFIPAQAHLNKLHSRLQGIGVLVVCLEPVATPTFGKRSVMFWDLLDPCLKWYWGQWSCVFTNHAEVEFHTAAIQHKVFK